MRSPRARACGSTRRRGPRWRRNPARVRRCRAWPDRSSRSRRSPLGVDAIVLELGGAFDQIQGLFQRCRVGAVDQRVDQRFAQSVALARGEVRVRERNRPWGPAALGRRPPRASSRSPLGSRRGPSRRECARDVLALGMAANDPAQLPSAGRSPPWPGPGELDLAVWVELLDTATTASALALSPWVS